MASTKNLAEISKGKSYEVAGFTSETSDYAEKLYKMGFVKGTPVELAPVKISDPMVVQIRGSRIALRKKEAQEILVREVGDA
ncbi:MAG: ferrous iron transport protein A [Desulfobulbaceae bacterium]|nr:MAG: ferrous iron transport protein A [Desulfobulbaceae bacterium]